MKIDMKEVIRVPWRRGITRDEFFTKFASEAIVDMFTFKHSYLGPDLSNLNTLSEALIQIIAFSRKGIINDCFTITIPNKTPQDIMRFTFSVKDFLGVKDTDDIDSLEFDWQRLNTSTLFNFLKNKK